MSRGLPKLRERWFAGRGFAQVMPREVPATVRAEDGLRDGIEPLGWAAPAFDVLQLEDYEWVTAGDTALTTSAKLAPTAASAC